MHLHESSRQLPRENPNASRVRVAFQGVAGAYGEEAVRRAWHGHAQAVPARTFAEALDQLACGVVDWAVIPVWNSTMGPVLPARAALHACASAITVIREVEVPVRHSLLALPGTSMSDIRFVGSHPAALAQCTRLFAEQPNIIACEAFDTAGAARELSLLNDPTQSTLDTWYSALRADAQSLAAIASGNAGRRYGLSILCEGVQDDPSNVTRFVVVRAKETARW